MAFLVKPSPPCLVHEDEHLLVINKPCGINTHAPDRFAGEGIYDWLRHREPRWAKLAIVHRLDKETSGLLVFTKTPLANRSLTEQFTRGEVRKRYLLLTDRTPPAPTWSTDSALVRAGAKYLSRPLHAGGQRAETHFRVVHCAAERTLIEAKPVTGRTHQIRVHAASSGCPVLGDALYQGTTADRVYLHAQGLRLRHPATGAETEFYAAADFAAGPATALRLALIDPDDDDVYRLIHGAADGYPEWFVDRLGDFLLSQSDGPLTASRKEVVDGLVKTLGLRGIYHKQLSRRVRHQTPDQGSPAFVSGERLPATFLVRENGLRFELSFKEGGSVGLFADQRDNRRRLLCNHVASGFPLWVQNHSGAEVLNTFAYTCGFSVCAAKAGARVTSVDLSPKCLEWGKRNFSLNGLDPARHDFLYGDSSDWLRRLAKKNRSFDVIVVDPPTFSRSKGRGTFQVEKDLGNLVAGAVTLLRSGGVLFVSTNAAGLAPGKFLEMISAAISSRSRKIVQQHYVPQPPDFPVHRLEPAYLKTVWSRID